ncbi:MAG: hypothetical protein GEV03_11675 [Streptosporangiales bacterium]|nr:hypothetical protein [Streptosporangiales bacterium]
MSYRTRGFVYDYEEIIRRGGVNGGDEDFILIKCPHCGYLYLHDYEIDTVYTNPDDLGQRQDVDLARPDTIHRVACGEAIPGACDTTRRRGKPDPLGVTWDEAAHSPWAWTIRPDAWPPGLGPPGHR